MGTWANFARTLLWLRLRWSSLRWLIPSYWGLVRLKEPTALHEVFEKLSAQCIGVVYVFEAQLEQALLQVSKENSIQQWSQIVKGGRHLIYLVDEDRVDSPTGMVEAYSFSPQDTWKGLDRGSGGRLNGPE